MTSVQTALLSSLAERREQIGYLHGRITESIANAVDKIRPLDARYALTNAMVRHARALLLRERERIEIVPLPATEAIANQFFVLSLNDPHVFVHLLLTFYRSEVPMASYLHDRGTKDALHFDDADTRYFEAVADIADFEACASGLQLDAHDKERLFAQHHLLGETIRYLAEELVDPHPLHA
ncbi:hypothetical protein WKR88_18790 [Trinickia caryophylli]|uniref:Uncharacterized protein n=1 Tax=Trinickia caryophylli TaxID=28094 RepID=A0A1X7DH34_TRICW|nr:hypothetical protein [Trinickia caryophylli]PMS12405.1 hypothetical protein C0Z17_10320 [Trinickia caryophylli]TRX16979.1 hypothetical protein FNF07_01200 [Trinickia caryophylli]WQE12283.1 hypothetical protein U0034_02350 [Trinickia caryophylli]SMF15452.1 hypothetical protein SAMN06295900_103201 [Trinickia caryophylli]GLU31571.1 hypothetical protein Busp01_14130 [Trinickia caryophylli]